MRPLEELDTVRWELYRGPRFYRPAEVPHALRRLMAVHDEQSMRDAYNRCLFSFGNNHAGVLYYAAVEAAPFLSWVVANGAPWPKLAALEVLQDALLFGPDSEEYAPAPDGQPTLLQPPDLLFRERVREDVDTFLTVLRDNNAYDELRIAALEVIEQLVDIPRVKAELTAMGESLDSRRMRLVPYRRRGTFEEVRIQWLRENIPTL